MCTVTDQDKAWLCFDEIKEGDCICFKTTEIHKSENFTPSTHPTPSILLNKSLEAEQQRQDITQEQFQATFSIKNMAVLK